MTETPDEKPGPVGYYAIQISPEDTAELEKEFADEQTYIESGRLYSDNTYWPQATSLTEWIEQILHEHVAARLHPSTGQTPAAG